MVNTDDSHIITQGFNPGKAGDRQGGLAEQQPYQGAYTGRGQLLGAGAALAIPAPAREADGLDVSGGGASAPSLVTQGITQPTNAKAPRQSCPNAGWLKGVCQHGTARWVRLRCKRRDCPVCGFDRRRMMAWRIAHGLDVLGGERGGGWFVGTFSRDVSKREAVKVQGKFIRWLRKGERVRKVRRGEDPDGVPWLVEPQPDLEYAATWEKTRAGRLHLNLILAPWVFAPQGQLSRAFERFGGGSVVWIQRVGGGIGVEAAKSREGVGGYVGKWEQMVMSGRGVAYSKGWPKLPDNPFVDRKGAISWRWVGAESDDGRVFWHWEVAMGQWVEVAPGEWKSVWGEGCDCFDRSGADDG